MNQKQIGVIVIIAAIVLASVVLMFKIKEDNEINAMIKELGSCYLSDGTCLHSDRDYMPYIAGWTLSAALVALGVYLIVFDKTQKILAENQEKIAEAMTKNKKDERFDAFLGGFGTEEKHVLKAIHEQDGIMQSTLRYRTGMSKATLSLLLKSLEERDIISKKPDGKTNRLYLRQRF